MSAVPIEPSRAKKLKASERDQQKCKPFVPAFAIQIIVVIRSLIDACLMGSKFACSRAVLALIAALCLASPVTNAVAADITVWPADKNGRIFVDVSGDIAVGDEKTFGEKTANLDADHTYVSLVSDGGNSITGSIGDIIRFRGMNTYVGPNATCTDGTCFSNSGVIGEVLLEIIPEANSSSGGLSFLSMQAGVQQGDRVAHRWKPIVEELTYGLTTDRRSPAVIHAFQLSAQQAP